MNQRSANGHTSDTRAKTTVQESDAIANPHTRGRAAQTWLSSRCLALSDAHGDAHGGAHGSAHGGTYCRAHGGTYGRAHGDAYRDAQGDAHVDAHGRAHGDGQQCSRAETDKLPAKLSTRILQDGVWLLYQ